MLYLLVRCIHDIVWCWAVLCVSCVFGNGIGNSVCIYVLLLTSTPQDIGLKRRPLSHSRSLSISLAMCICYFCSIYLRVLRCVPDQTHIIPLIWIIACVPASYSHMHEHRTHTHAHTLALARPQNKFERKKYQNVTHTLARIECLFLKCKAEAHRTHTHILAFCTTLSNAIMLMAAKNVFFFLFSLKGKDYKRSKHTRQVC